MKSNAPSGFSSITQKRKNIFSSNLVTFGKWVTIYTIKLEDRSFHVAMAKTQIKGVNKEIFEKKFFSVLTSEMESATIN